MLKRIENIIPLHYRQKILKKFFSIAVSYWRRISRDCDPRKWSNDELKKLAPYFTGRIINISGGKDLDKENEKYNHYFVNSDSFTVANYPTQYPDKCQANDLFLDLSVPLEDGSPFLAAYDVVFTHTVLEHIYELNTAVSNLCKISKDIVITVIPFIQAFHQNEEYYHDYWRISPYSIYNLFKDNGFDTVYCKWNNDPIGNIYLFHIASKKKENWEHIIMRNYDKSFIQGPGAFRQSLLSNIKIETMINTKIKISDVIE